MSVKDATKDYRLSRWMEKITDRHQSGLTVKDYCNQEGISTHTYYYWQQKLRKIASAQLQASNPSVPSGWIQLNQSNKQSPGITLEINSCLIHVKETTDPVMLRNICRLLKTL